MAIVINTENIKRKLGLLKKSGSTNLDENEKKELVLLDEKIKSNVQRILEKMGVKSDNTMASDRCEEDGNKNIEPEVKMSRADKQKKTYEAVIEYKKAGMEDKEVIKRVTSELPVSSTYVYKTIKMMS